MGPTPRTASISPDVNDPGARNIDFEQLRAAYYDQVEALVEGGVDVILVETIFDTLNAKAALFAIDEFFERHAFFKHGELVVLALIHLNGRARHNNRLRLIAGERPRLAHQRLFGHRDGEIALRDRHR